MPIPGEPIFFLKATSAICGPNDDVIIPKGSEKTDYEVELGIVIGSTARYVEVQGRARSTSPAIASSMTCPSANSRSSAAANGPRARAATRSARSARGSSPPTRCADAGKLQLWTEVNGERRQDSNTADLIFGIEHIVSYVSQFMTLTRATSSRPARRRGWQWASSRRNSCKPGDRVRLGVEGLGEQNQRMVAWQG